MSDLLAPVLCEIKCEAEAFWCFVGLMQRAIFVCTPTDNDMDNNLVSPCAHIMYSWALLTRKCFYRDPGK